MYFAPINEKINVNIPKQEFTQQFIVTLAIFFFSILSFLFYFKIFTIFDQIRNSISIDSDNIIRS